MKITTSENDRRLRVKNEYIKFLSKKYISYMSSANGLELMILAKLLYPDTNKYTNMSINDAMNWAEENIEAS